MHKPVNSVEQKRLKLMIFYQAFGKKKSGNGQWSWAESPVAVSESVPTFMELVVSGRFPFAFCTPLLFTEVLSSVALLFPSELQLTRATIEKTKRIFFIPGKFDARS